MGFFCVLRLLVRKLACPFGHPTQVSTQVQLAATCDYLRVRLAKALVWSVLLSTIIRVITVKESVVWTHQISKLANQQLQG